MILQMVERVIDKGDNETHAATITTDAGVFHTDFFPILFIGMEFEEENIFINNKYVKAYMPTGLGSCEDHYRPKGKNLDKESNEKFSLERCRRDVMFYYATKDYLSYREIVLLTFRGSHGKYRDIYDNYEKDPYTLLCETSKDVGNFFSRFTKISENIVPKTFEERLIEYKYGARYILCNMEESGDTYMPYGEFKEKFLNLFKSLGKPMRYGCPRAILTYFDEFDIDPIPDDTAKVFRTETKRREMDILQIVNQYRNASSPFPSFLPKDMDTFTEEQCDAVKNAIICKGRISIITGGPGVGKTTVLKKIIDTMEEEYPDIKVRFLASTGKAANRIKESIGHRKSVTISTVHKFLGLGCEYRFDHDRVKEIKESGLVIVDESSMTDILVFDELINALVMQNTKLILVGDCDQLPSVDAGDILSNLIALKVPCFYLTKNHRNNGAILKNAKKIITGDPFLEEDEHFRIVSSAPSIGWMNAGLRVACEDLKIMSDNNDNRELAVFSPYRKEYINGSAYHMNKLVQASIFHDDKKCRDYYIGDRVVFTRTDYAAGYFNGDLGVLTGYKNGNYIVSVDGNDKVVMNPLDIDLAYSITIHKSQGSEYDEVMISIPKYSSFITRRMLYTAVTRAKNKVTIYASKGTIRRIIMNNSDYNRRTFLSIAAKAI